MGKDRKGEQLLREILAEKGLLDDAGFKDHREAYAQATKLGVKTTMLKFLIDRGVVTEEDASAVRKEFVRRGKRPMLGEYELIEKLGEGGMGTVYKAQHPRLKTIVAIKQVSSEIAKDKRRLRRFEREAQVAAKLSDVDIVRVMDVKVDGPRPFIVMEYVDGETLEDVIKRGPIDEKEALEVVRDVAATLHVLHKNGVIHRDIKPANIMITSAGKVKVADLGIAKELAAGDTSITMAGSGIGTPAYAAPEQSTDAKAVDHRADIYALGGTLYNMVTGHMPFRADTPYKIMMMHASEPLVDPAELHPDLSRGTADLICNMMEKSPDARIQSADAVAKIAQTLITALTSGTAIKTAGPAGKEKKPLPWKFIGAVGGGVAVLAIVGALLLSVGDEGATPDEKHVAVVPRAQAPTQPAPAGGDPSPKPPSEPTEAQAPIPTPSPTELPAPNISTPPASSSSIGPTPTERVTPVAGDGPKPVPLEPLFTTPPLPAKVTVKVHSAALTDIWEVVAEGNTIWCAGYGGATRYDPAKRTWLYLDERHGLAMPVVRAMAADGKGRKWFAGEDHCAVLSRYDGEQWKAWEAPGLSFAKATLAVRKDGNVVMVDRSKHHIFDGTRFTALENEYIGAQFSVSVASDGSLISAHPEGVRILSDDLKQCRTIPYPTAWGEASYATVLADELGRFWLTVRANKGYDGIWQFQDNAFARKNVSGVKAEAAWGPLVLHPKDGPHVLAGQSLLRLYKGRFRRIADNDAPLGSGQYLAGACDADGNLYMASRFGPGGLYVFMGRGWREVRQPMALPGRVSAVRVGKDGFVYVGTARGMVAYDGKKWRPIDMRGAKLPDGNNRIRNMALAPNGTLAMICGLGGTALAYRDGRWSGPAQAGSSVRTGAEHQIIVDDAGGIVVYGHALARFDGSKWQYWTEKEGLLGKNGYPVLHPQTRDIWLTGRYRFLGLNRLRRGQLEAVRIENVPEGFLAYSLAIDDAGRKWVGGMLAKDQAVLLVIEGTRVERIVAIMPCSGQVTQYPYSLRFGPKGRLWAGMENGGLACYDGKTWRFIRPEDGLLSSRIYDFDFAPDGSVWVATANGVSHVTFDE